MRANGLRTDGVILTERIFEAQADDAGRLAKLGRATSKVWFAKVYSQAELKAFLQRDFTEEGLRQQLMQPKSFTFLLHEVAGKAVGFARINWDRPVPFSDERGAELQKIYYLPASTGQGYGRRLMAAVTDKVVARGVTTLWLDVLKTNPGARALYERLGFEWVGELPFKTDLGEIGMDVLRRDLD